MEKIKSLTIKDAHEQTRNNLKIKSLTIKNHRHADKYIQLLTIKKNTTVKKYLIVKNHGTKIPNVKN